MSGANIGFEQMTRDGVQTRQRACRSRSDLPYQSRSLYHLRTHLAERADFGNLDSGPDRVLLERRQILH